MTGQEFKQALQNPKNVYCLISTDSEIIDLYVSRFKNAIHADAISYGQIIPYSKLLKKTFLNVLYVKKLDEELFENPNYLFIYTESIDKRSALYKKYKNQIIEVENDYVKFIMQNSNFNENQAKYFAKANNNDLGLIKNALKLYKDSDYTYKRLTDYSNDIYGWVDAFIKHTKLPNCTESPISILALLSTNCQNILRVKQKDTVGMNPYVVQCSEQMSSYMTEKELVQIINDCFYLECQVKKGLIDTKDILGYIIARRNSYVTN